MKCFFPKDILQWFFSKEGNKSDILKLEEKNLIGFLGPNFLKRFIPNYSTIKYTHTSLKRTLSKGSRF